MYKRLRSFEDPIERFLSICGRRWVQFCTQKHGRFSQDHRRPREPKRKKHGAKTNNTYVSMQINGVCISPAGSHGWADERHAGGDRYLQGRRWVLLQLLLLLLQQLVALSGPLRVRKRERVVVAPEVPRQHRGVRSVGHRKHPRRRYEHLGFEAGEKRQMAPRDGWVRGRTGGEVAFNGHACRASIRWDEPR